MVVNNHNTTFPSITCAKIVGISDYQEQGIPDLMYIQKMPKQLPYFCARPQELFLMKTT
jgi:hypothetical protein